MSKLRLALLLGSALALAACGADDVASPGEGTLVGGGATGGTGGGTGAAPAPGTPAADCPAGTTNVGTVGAFRSCRIPALITGNLTLPRRAGTAYEINGRVDVGVDVGGAGTATGGVSATLTIEPGVLVYANTTNADNDFLVVNRGSRMVADGTETAPIIFTAQQNLAGTVTDESQGLWGGIIMAGRAPIANCNLAGVAGGAANCENVVEGTGNALYGGATPTDSSGVVRYVQIRYSGTVISPDNELQGLTLGGVGSGTTLSHIQVHNSSDDGIEIFGGRANMRYVVATGSDDDAFDVDTGWQGFVQFLLTVQKPSNTQTDNFSMEIDSNGSEDALPRTFGRLANFTLIQTSTATNAAIRLRGGADFTFVNGIVVNTAATRGCLTTVATNSATDRSTIRAANATLQDAGPPVFNSVAFACGATPFIDGTGGTPAVTITGAEMLAIFNAGTNNAATAVSTLTGTFVNGTNESGRAAFNAATLNPAGTSFLVSTTYIGAVRDANDTWFRGWTCNSNRAAFGSPTACTALPN
jgi:hypothetical protein